MYVKRSESTCKPGSVSAPRAVLVIYLRLLSPVASIVLPSGSGGQPSCTGLHELSTSGMHSTHVAMRLVGSYPTFSPLPGGKASRRSFSSASASPRGLLPVRKRIALCCPDFPLFTSHPGGVTSDKPADSHSFPTKVIQYI